MRPGRRTRPIRTCRREDDAELDVDEVETGKFRRSRRSTSRGRLGGVTAGRHARLLACCYGLVRGRPDPNGLPAATTTVEVLFDLHAALRRAGAVRGTDWRGHTEDVATARIAQQLETSGRPMIAVLPQGAMGKDGPSSGRTRAGRRQLRTSTRRSASFPPICGRPAEPGARPGVWRVRAQRRRRPGGTMLKAGSCWRWGRAPSRALDVRCAARPGPRRGRLVLTDRLGHEVGHLQERWNREERR